MLDSEKYNLKLLVSICAACSRKEKKKEKTKGKAGRMKERKREKKKGRRLDNEEVTQKFKM